MPELRRTNSTVGVSNYVSMVFHYLKTDIKKTALRKLLTLWRTWIVEKEKQP